MINRNACFAYFNKSWGIPFFFETGLSDRNVISLLQLG
jgi:hypothetical protein